MSASSAAPKTLTHSSLTEHPTGVRITSESAVTLHHSCKLSGVDDMLHHMSIPRAAAVVVDAGKILIIQRYLRHDQADACVMCEASKSPGPNCQGHHYAVIPGGHVEPGESPEEAAVRELEEETTLTAEIDRLLWTGTHNGRPAHYFLMTKVHGTAHLSGSEAAAHCENDSYELLWIALPDLEALGIYPSDVHPHLSHLIGL